jgi:hypothetical protein
MNITILKIRESQPGCLRGYFDVEIEGITIRDCRIIQQPNQRAFITGPQRQIGPKNWFTIVSFQDDVRQEIQDQLLPRAREMKIIV